LPPADGLRRDDAHSLTALHHPAGREIAAVAKLADAALGFAGQHRTDLNALATGGLNGGRQISGDLLVHVDDHVALIIKLALESHADNAVAQQLDDFARFDDRFDVVLPRRPLCREQVIPSKAYIAALV